MAYVDDLLCGGPSGSLHPVRMEVQKMYDTKGTTIRWVNDENKLLRRLKGTPHRWWQRVVRRPAAHKDVDGRVEHGVERRGRPYGLGGDSFAAVEVGGTAEAEGKATRRW